MRPIPFAFLFVLALVSSPAVTAATPPDPLLLQGLQTCVTNGVDSGVRVWYSDRPAMGAEMSNVVSTAARGLGDVIDSEVVAVQPVSKRVTRFYVALYFTRSPLWVRIERYENGTKAFFLPLKCSTNPDDILPGYITEFLR
ncbi:MAG TPA: hypothetical protein VHE61_06010 [Opitutaceae bacterium]|nr:hypothetical protein [Opitutaceae bacterium]